MVEDEETTFDALIASCSCASPWHDPNQQDPTTITFDGNFNKSAPVRRRDAAKGNDEPVVNTTFDGGKTLHIYPNPSDGKIWIEAKGISGRQKILIFSSEGRMVFEGNHDFHSDASFFIDLQNQPKGLYNITMQDSQNGTYHNEKLVLK